MSKQVGRTELTGSGAPLKNGTGRAWEHSDTAPLGQGSAAGCHQTPGPRSPMSPTPEAKVADVAHPRGQGRRCRPPQSLRSPLSPKVAAVCANYRRPMLTSATLGMGSKGRYPAFGDLRHGVEGPRTPSRAQKYPQRDLNPCYRRERGIGCPGTAYPTAFLPVFTRISSASSATEKTSSPAFVARMLPRCRPVEAADSGCSERIPKAASRSHRPAYRARGARTTVATSGELN